MLEIIIQALLSILCVFGAVFIKILICREIFFERRGIIKTAVIPDGENGAERALEIARRYYGLRVCVIFTENADEKEIEQMRLRHPKTLIFKAKTVQSGRNEE